MGVKIKMWKDILCSQIGMIHTDEISMVPKQSTVNITVIKLSIDFIMGSQNKSIPTFVQNHKRTQIIKINKDGVIKIFDLKNIK